MLLQIWSDQPKDAQNLYSHPRDMLWESGPLQGVYRIYEGPIDPGEFWYDPNTGELLPDNDHFVWQANFDLSDRPFHQTEGEIYWLAVQMFYPAGTGEQAELGWKTSKEHWNDDAVWADYDDSGIVPVWNELRYPDGHPFQGESMDLAFVITVPEPGTLVLLATVCVGLLFVWRRRK